MKLNIWAFSLALGICWGVGIFVVTWWVLQIGAIEPGATTLLGRVYIGYNVSALGSVIRAVWGFVTGFIGGLVFCWLYNAFDKTAASGAEQPS